MGSGCCIGNCCVGNCCIGKAIKDFFCSNNCCVGNSSGGHTVSVENAEAKDLLKIQKALDEFSSDTRNRSTKLENNIIEESRESLDDFMAELRTYNKIRYGNKKLNINISNIEREQRKTEDKIHGFIVNRVAKRTSLDDKECYEILKLDPGKEKTKKLNEFYRKASKEAILELTNVLRDAMEKQTDIVEDRIQQRIDNIVDICETKSENFDKIQRLKKKDESKFEQEQIKLSHYVALCEYGISIL